MEGFTTDWKIKLKGKGEMGEFGGLDYLKVLSGIILVQDGERL